MIHDNATDAKIATTLTWSSFMTDASHFSIDTNEFVVGQTGCYEIYYFASYQSTSNQTSVWFCATTISDGSTWNRIVVNLNNTSNTWRPLSLLFGQRFTASTDRHTFTIKKW